MRRTPMAIQRLLRIGAALSLVSSVGCKSATQGIAPDGAELTILVDPDSMFVNDTVDVVAVLRLETGQLAGSGWRVELESSRGRLTASGGLVAILTTDAESMARTKLIAPASPGMVILRASAVDTQRGDSVRVVQRPAAPR